MSAPRAWDRFKSCLLNRYLSLEYHWSPNECGRESGCCKKFVPTFKQENFINYYVVTLSDYQQNNTRVDRWTERYESYRNACYLIPNDRGGRVVSLHRDASKAAHDADNFYLKCEYLDFLCSIDDRHLWEIVDVTDRCSHLQDDPDFVETTREQGEVVESSTKKFFQIRSLWNANGRKADFVDYPNLWEVDFQGNVTLGYDDGMIKKSQLFFTETVTRPTD